MWRLLVDVVGENMFWHHIKMRVKDMFTNLGFRLIVKFNKWHNDSLSWRLHRLADRYAEYPKGKWG